MGSHIASISALDSAELSSAVFIRNCIIYAAISFHAYEWLHHLRFEIGYIWRKAPSSLVKWQYLFSRYTGLSTQLASAIFYFYTRHDTSERLCRRWIMFQLVSAQNLVSSLEISLIHRVMALYDGNTHLAVFLVLLVAADYAGSVTWGFIALRRMEVGRACMTMTLSPAFAYLGAMHVLVGCAMWSLIFLKYYKETKIPILVRVIRDGSFAFGAFLAMFIGLLASAYISKHVYSMLIYQALTPLILLTFASVNCRIIANMQKVTRTGPNNSSIFEFTSIITDYDNRISA